MPKHLFNRKKQNIILLVLILVYVFLLSPFPPGEARQVAYSIVFSGIFVVAASAIKKKSNFYFYISSIAIILEWISDFYKLTFTHWLAAVSALLFFFLIIVRMMIRISRSKNVGQLEFLEAVNVYFLLGVLGSIFFSVINSISPAAFHFPEGVIATRADFIYYSFVTISTLGYGDIIPVSSIAKNMSIMLSISGQLYLAMIVAMLVGKYLTKSK